MATVLFVDDDPAVLVTFPRVLRREPYRVVVAASATAALAILEREPIDVVVSDQQMPGMRGTELLAQVKRLYPATIRIILTGEAGTTSDAELGAEVYCVLRKPSYPGEIKGAIAEALRSHAARQLPD
jgi:DNA-binding NtrC family response regulator